VPALAAALHRDRVGDEQAHAGETIPQIVKISLANYVLKDLNRQANAGEVVWDTSKSRKTELHCCCGQERQI
jgi:hypothetical protein